MKIKIISTLLLIVIVLTSLVGCDEKIEAKRCYVDEQNHVIVEFTDGSTQDLGLVGTTNPPDTTKDSDVADTTSPAETDEPKQTVTIKGVTVNDQFHAIVEFSDGTTQDLGYVGVEVEPPLYKVVFQDKNGNTLSEQEVYKGKAAKAPSAPTIPDTTFDRWDTDFTSVQSDLTVKPIYIAAAEYKVTFLDENGATLKTETVIAGHGATAPTPPTRTDTVFDKWDTAFTNVKSDLTVRAVYRQKGSYTVTFKDYSGLVLGTVQVKEGDSVTAPTTPARDGYKFTGWSGSLSGIKSNQTVTAKYSLNSSANVIDISYVITSADTLTLTVAVKGKVKFCSIEGNIAIPSGFTYKSVKAGDTTTANYESGKIYFVTSSTSGKDITAETAVMTVTLTYKGVKNGKFTLTVNDIYDQNYVTLDKTVIGETVTVAK